MEGFPVKRRVLEPRKLFIPGSEGIAHPVREVERTAGTPTKRRERAAAPGLLEGTAYKAIVRPELSQILAIVTVDLFPPELPHMLPVTGPQVLTISIAKATSTPGPKPTHGRPPLAAVSEHSLTAIMTRYQQPAQ